MRAVKIKTIGIVILLCVIIYFAIRYLPRNPIPIENTINTEETVSPLVITEIKNLALLSSYQHDGMIHKRRIMPGSLGSEIEMGIYYNLRVECWTDLSNISDSNIVLETNEETGSTLTIHLPKPYLSPVEIVYADEYLLRTKNIDNAGAGIASLRSSLRQEAFAEFNIWAVENNCFGLAEQSAENTIRGLVESIMDAEGTPVTVRVLFD